MPGLTVTEKEHWKDRIGRRIDKRIETISAEDPSLLERVERDARQRALQSLGLAEQHARLDEIERQREALDREAQRIQRELLALIRGVAVSEIDAHAAYRYQCEVEAAVRRRQAVFEDGLLQESDVGRRILELRGEKEGLLDSVWLATSPTQIKSLWSRVTDLLGDATTRLQQDALAIAPLDGGDG
jgi:hypothetical protein